MSSKSELFYKGSLVLMHFDVSSIASSNNLDLGFRSRQSSLTESFRENKLLFFIASEIK
jgi:hypothetical protein